MSSRTPTYDEIRRLANDLRHETRVKARREVGIKLYDKLKNELILTKLATEATPERTNWPEEDSVIAKRCRALSGVWVSVIQGAMNVAQSIVAGKKVKLTEHDVHLPYHLLLACEKSKPIIWDDSVAIPMLPRKTVRGLLKYCLELLENDEVSFSHVKLMEMLGSLCSKPEYVGVFKHHQDFSYILSEISFRLTPEVEERHSSLFAAAAKALESLFTTTSLLGIEMHIFVSSTLELLSGYCKSFLDNQATKVIRPQSPELVHLFLTVAIMLRAHPDHAMAPMKRFGRPVLRFARKCYANSKSPVKEALNSYLLAHM